MAGSRLRYQQQDTTGYARPVTTGPTLIALERKGYQGRSPWLVSERQPECPDGPDGRPTPRDGSGLTGGLWITCQDCAEISTARPLIVAGAELLRKR